MRAPRKAAFFCWGFDSRCSSSPPISVHHRFAVDLPLLPLSGLFTLIASPSPLPPPRSIISLPQRDLRVHRHQLSPSSNSWSRLRLPQGYLRRVSPVSPPAGVHVTSASSTSGAVRIASGPTSASDHHRIIFAWIFCIFVDHPHLHSFRA